MDIKAILRRAKDERDNTCVAMVTLDYLAHQCLDFVTSDFDQLAMLLVTFICTSFGLDKSNSQTISQASRFFQA